MPGFERNSGISNLKALPGVNCGFSTEYSPRFQRYCGKLQPLALLTHMVVTVCGIGSGAGAAVGATVAVDIDSSFSTRGVIAKAITAVISAGAQ